MTALAVPEKKVLELFGVNLSKREINKMVFEDFDRGHRKFIQPKLIHGILHGKPETIFTTDRLIVAVEETPNEELINWKENIITPKWRVRTCRDPDGVTRHLQKAYVHGPAYEIGRRGSTGPFYAVSTRIDQIYCG